MVLRNLFIVFFFGVSVNQSTAQQLYSFGAGSDGAEGVFFSWNIETSTYTEHASFSPSLALGESRGRLLFGGGDTFFGTAKFGPTNHGVIYKVNVANGAVDIVHALSYNDGTSPSYGLSQHNGQIYGITGTNGTLGGGTLFRLNPINGEYTVLYDFDDNDNNGVAFPKGELLITPNGIVYGVTERGGIENRGVIYSYNLSTNDFQALYSFTTATGRMPYSGLTPGPDGNFYGVTLEGGVNNHGVLYRFDPQTNNYTKLRDFAYSTGSGPLAQLTFGPDGNIYGSCWSGGNGSQGVLFKYELEASSYTVLKEFDTNDLYSPRSELVFGDDGNLYGLTTFGGFMFSGGIFRYNLATSTYTSLYDLSGNAGSGMTPFARKSGPGLVSVPQVNAKSVLQIYPNPAGERVYVTSQLTQSNSQMSLLTSDGRLCGNLPYIYLSDNTFMLDTRQLPSGVYQLVIKNNSGTVAEQGRIVVP